MSDEMKPVEEMKPIGNGVLTPAPVPGPIPAPPKAKKRFSIFWPLLLIAVGVVLFLANTNAFPNGAADLLAYWPVLLIAAGLDNFWRGESYVGGVLSVGLGGLFLFANLGYLPGVYVLDVLVRFWPVFLVALGLDLIIGHRGWLAAIAGLAVGVVLTGGLCLFILTNATPTTLAGAGAQDVALTNKDSSAVTGEITMAVGELRLSGGAEPAYLVSGKAMMTGQEQLGQSFETTSGGRATYTLRSEGVFNPVRFNTPSTVWDLKLNSTVPTNLSVKIAVGEIKADLTGVNLARFSANIAVGKMVITLPASSALGGEIKGAVGELVIIVPRSAVVRLQVDNALASLSLPSDWSRNDKIATSPNQQTAGPMIDLTVGMALGSVSVRYLP